ncbi:hypothetical protein N7490_006135 [Penicillium lividum]|nr:hypothetical protein N7490_006135 [Penicillium lividum]
MGRNFSIFRGHKNSEEPKIDTTSRSRNIFSSSSTATPWDPPAYEEYQSQPTPPRISGDDPLSFLGSFDTVFLVDDSSSMYGPRWKEAEAAIAAIAPICTQYDSDGIDLYFLNHRNERNTYFQSSRANNSNGAYENIKSAQEVREIFSSVTPRGGTLVGRRLHDILAPYMQRVQAMQTSRDPDGTYPDAEKIAKPVNIITITDGAFSDDAESVIVQVARILDSSQCMAVPWQVGIQFFQIGNDKKAMAYLQELDDDLGKCDDGNLRDIVDTVPWRGSTGTLNAEGILKCVLGAVNKKLDRKMV